MEHEADTLRRLLKEQDDENTPDPNTDGLLDQINEPDPAEHKYGIDPTQTLSPTSVNPSQWVQDTPYFTPLGRLHNPPVDTIEVFENLMDHFTTVQVEATTKSVNDVYEMFESFKLQTLEAYNNMRADIVKQNNMIDQHSDGLNERDRIQREEINLLKQQHKTDVEINQTLINLCKDSLRMAKPLNDEIGAIRDELQILRGTRGRIH